ncbi:hypothetical protein [Iodobacter fluviatilis]|uniref:Uncharacterized protein n=1 Tax=Iodobacter fluviatilis TaxID=537 RepID=A0A377Q802_9NEIS|nr:hypothetical protein [Iodobacter fluviatilis]TCU88545.1 hypothetical protein EV682_103129 [Iodobacter fluviatilis]STQ91384.1 Uncharacterised protein [Iodobacter fluviatilis]
MPLSDLITNPQTKRLSHSKLWANVACAASTAVFIKQGWAGTLSSEGWLVYLGVVGGYAVARHWLATRKGGFDAADLQKHKEQ